MAEANNVIREDALGSARLRSFGVPATWPRVVGAGAMSKVPFNYGCFPQTIGRNRSRFVACKDISRPTGA